MKRILLSTLLFAACLTAQKPPVLSTPANSEGPTRAVAPDYSRRPGAQVSTEDLNSLRDTNVRKVNKSGCPPEVAMRIAELKAKHGLGKSMPPEASADLADRWHKRSAAAFDSSKEKEQLLDWVLGAPGASKSTEASADAQKAEAELQRLAAMCPEVR